MLRLLFAFAVVAAIGRAESPKNNIDLFEGHDLAAWELITLPGTSADIAKVCKFNVDGSLAVAGKPVSYLAMTTPCENFRLHAEWRWPADAAKNSNSGVLLNVTGGPTNNTAWPVCFQMQMKLNRAGDMLPMNDAKFAEKLSTAPGAKTPQLDRVADSSEKPLGEWNTCDVVCRGETIDVTVNGVHQNKVTKCEPAKGKIGFQLEGTPFELRNVRIAPLQAINGSYQSSLPAKGR